MTGAELAERLRNLPPADVPAVRLLLELQEPDVEAAMATARRGEIEAALGQLERQLSQTKGIIRRCEDLRPIPSRRVPIGI